MGDLDRPRTSTRDLDALAARLGGWLGGDVREVSRPQGAGLSSETLLFEVSGERYVLRMAPPADAFPLFPSYDLDRQADAMRIVAGRSRVPVPDVAWVDSTGAVLGAPCFVMARAGGEVVSDVPPYVFGGWLVDAGPETRASIRRGAVDVLAGIHGIELDATEQERFAFDLPGGSPLERHVENQRRYFEWIRGGERFPLIEATFAWLEDRWPAEGEPVLSWGDARLANILWRDGDPVAVLDWEAVAVGPRELDLGWLIFFHEYFQRVAGRYGYEGIPDLLPRELVAREYASASGHQPAGLDWFLVYAELRQALTSIRVTSRAVHFGERPAPDDPQDLILERSHLEAIVT